MSLIARENPAHPSEIVGKVAASDPPAVDAVVRAADRAFGSWSRLTVSDRLAALRDCWTVDEAAVAELLARELGKVKVDCTGEVGFAGRFLDWAAGRAEDVLADRLVEDDAGRLVVEHRPFGVVAAITPWNAPIILTMLKLAPALAAGNCIVVKPSPLAPLAITAVVEQMATRLPEGVLNIVHGDGAVGDALVGHELVRKVAFTGGGATARIVGRTAADRLTPTVLELGGNDPAIFLSDADVSEAVAERLLVAAFATSGQVCMAVKRVYAHSTIAADLVEALREVASRTVIVGDPLDDRVTMGPMVTQAAADRVDSLVAEATAAGATVHELGSSRDLDPAGYYCLPRLVTGVGDEARLVGEEQFGPALPLLTFQDVDEVISLANAGDLGLGASVWSRDEDRAFAVARQLEAGFRFVNTHNRAGLTLRAPFGGVKRSGFGREYSDEGLLEYAQPCVVHAPAAVRGGGAAAPAAAYPSG